MHILFVEDEIIDRFLVKKILGTDFNVTTLSSHEEAIAFAKAQDFQIAVITVEPLQEKDSIDLLQGLRRIKSNSFRAYAMTCLYDERGEVDLIRAGFVDVLRKPYDLLNLKHIISIKLHGRTSRHV